MTHIILFDTDRICNVSNVMAVYFVEQLPSEMAIDRPNSNIMVISKNKAYIKKTLTIEMDIKKLVNCVQPPSIKIYLKDAVLAKDILNLFVSQGIDAHLITYSQTPE